MRVRYRNAMYVLGIKRLLFLFLFFKSIKLCLNFGYMKASCYAHFLFKLTRMQFPVSRRGLLFHSLKSRAYGKGSSRPDRANRLTAPRLEPFHPSEVWESSGTLRCPHRRKHTHCPARISHPVAPCVHQVLVSAGFVICKTPGCFVRTSSV